MAKDSFQFEITPELKTEKFATKIQGLLKLARSGSEQAADELNRILGGKKYDKITFGVDMDTKEAQVGMKTIRTEYDKVNRLMDKAEKTDRRSLTTLKAKLRTATQQRDAISKTVMVTDKYGNKVKKVNQAWLKQDKYVRQVKYKIAQTNGDLMGMASAKFPLIGKLGGMVGKLNAVVMGAQAVATAFQAIAQAMRPLVDRQKQVDGLRLALEGFGLSAQESGMVLESAKEISLRYGASLSSLEKAYKRITPAIMAAGGSLGEVGEVVEAMAARTAVLGLNTEQSGRYMEAFAQVMGKGKLQSEELNQQFSELDGSLRGQVAAYLATEHGIKDLDKAMQNGQVTAELFREAFVAISKPMKEQLAGSIANIQNRIDSMNVNQVQNVVNTLNTITLDSLRDTFSGFGNSLKQIYVAISSFVASVATENEALAAGVKLAFTVLGGVIEVTVNTVLAAARIAIGGLEGLINPLYRLIQTIKNNKIFGPLLEGVIRLKDMGVSAFRFLIGSVMRFSTDGIDGATKRLGTLQDSANRALGRVKADFDAGKITAEEFKNKTAEINQKLAELAVNEGMKELKKGMGEASEGFQVMAQNVVAGLERQNEGYRRQKQLIQENKTASLEAIDEQIRKAQEFHDGRIRQLNQQLTAIQDAKAAELGIVNEMTSAEKELEQLRMQEIQQKLSSNDLTRLERVELEARLDGMRRTIRIREINNKYANQEKSLAKQIKHAEEDRNAQVDDLKNSRREIALTFDEEIRTIEKAIRVNQSYITDIKTFAQEMKSFEADKTANLEKQEAHLAKIEQGTAMLQKAAPEIGKAFNSMTTNTANTKVAITSLFGPLNTVKTKLEGQIGDQNTQITNLNTLITKMKELAAEAAKVKIGGGDDGTRAEGGPVSGGSTYTVNELGKEAFLSASGKLSMINAPAYGKWRAPSTGVVIPAHLTEQLDIPKNGININQNVAARGGSIRPSVSSSSIRHGDNFNNSVTIQSNNPTQTANNMLVQLQKIKRGRLGR